MTKEWLLEPLDTLFFRGGKTMNKGEGGFIESIFPPTPETMQGVVRSSVLLSHCDEPELFSKKECDKNLCAKVKNCVIRKNIGTPDAGEYGALDLHGPYIVKRVGVNKYHRYFPAPLDLVKEKHINEGQADRRLFSLVPSDAALRCDMGNVRLPAKPDGTGYGAFSLAEGWIREDALCAYLNQNSLPDDKDEKKGGNGGFVEANKIFEREPRVGIARDNATHAVEDGMLYAIQQIRFSKDFMIGVRVSGLDDSLTPKGFATKFGGEGKICRLDTPNYLDKAQDVIVTQGKRIKMVLLQPADFNGSWRPSEFKETECNFKGEMTTCWEGELNTVRLRLLSACTGKPVRIGGWDMAKSHGKSGKSYIKPMKCFVPAGSVYFFEALSDGNLCAEGKIGECATIGFGHYMLGGDKDDC